VFRKLWTDFYGAQKFGTIGTGFTDEEFIMVCNEVAGTRLNDWFRKWLETAERPDYADIIGGFTDIQVTETSSELPGLHVQTKKENGALIVGFVHRNGTAAHLGLNVNDELLSLNDYRVTDDIDVLYAQLGSPKKLNILVSRGGKIISLKGEKTTVPQYQWDFSLRAKALGDPFWSQKGPLQTWLKPTL